MTQVLASDPPSTSCELSGIVGCTEPRLWTPPLRELTPSTSYGFEVVDFARDILQHPLDPWQVWTVVHAGELLPDGRPRFRRLLILVARQNGKTELLVVLTLYWMFVDRLSLVLGTSTKLDYAAESWRKACKLARRVPDLAGEIPKKGGIRKANGEQVLWRADEEEYALDEGSRYKIAASNEEAGRSLTIDRLVLDELRHHYSYDAWDASEPATSAAPDGGQVVAITNAGSDKSVVLNELREEALHYIKTGEGDQRLGLIEYSAPENASPTDVLALAQANPNLNIRKDAADLVAAGAAAMRKGGAKLAGFKTEHMCIHVKHMDPAINAEHWKGKCLVPGTLDGLRSRLALVFDVSLDGEHATAYAAAQLDSGKVRVDVVAAWESVAAMRRELPGLVRKVRPRVLGWLPQGPSASAAADMAERKDWPPPGVKIEEIRAETPAVCMGFSELVDSGGVLHSDDPLLNAQVEGAERKMQGDRWVYVRRGAGHVDAVYAAAGAVHLARTMPAPVGKPRIISARRAD